MVAGHLTIFSQLVLKGVSLQQVSVEVVQGEAEEDETRVNFLNPFFNILASFLLDDTPFLTGYKFIVSLRCNSNTF